MKTHVGAVISFLIIAIPSFAVASQTWPQIKDLARCRGNNSVVADCYSVHGRMFLANGTPSLRIWPVGTNRLLGVMPSEQEIIPVELRQWLNFGMWVYGNFEVCPFTSLKSGYMQFVCVESASNIVIEDFRRKDESPKYEMLHGTYTLTSIHSDK
jgi:hypothetical protein